MYSNKENVNILTALLLSKGVTDAVVCPGSRNAPIVHNLNECPSIHCHPVTDERSAGFYAIGIAQATSRPVVVCVTSGSALLNVAPAVAEAYYQHVPLIVVSADRPAQWIGQLDGQTLPQPGAFGAFVRTSVSLPEPADDEQRWHCRRLVSEALLLCDAGECAPVHINVPISEPLFSFSTDCLPELRTIKLRRSRASADFAHVIEDDIKQSSRPMIVFGQTSPHILSAADMARLKRNFVVLCEPLGSDSYYTIHGDEAVRAIGTDETYPPDLIIYIGDTVVSKPVRHFLRRAKAPTIMLTCDSRRLSDPTMSLADIVECSCREDIRNILTSISEAEEQLGQTLDGHATDAKWTLRRQYYKRWQAVLTAASNNAESYEPRYSQMAVVRYFEQQLDDLDFPCHTHYANSSAIRLACIYAAHRVWCNRGVNGIEGSLSTAAGFSLATDDMTVCVIGDLSFFYDQNALWNSNLRGNLRIILLNNGGGGIFRQLSGLEQSPAAQPLVAAAHSAEARGICTQNDIGYVKATTLAEAQIGIVRLLTEQTSRPMLLEVFTKADDDVAALRDYYSLLKK